MSSSRETKKETSSQCLKPFCNPLCSAIDEILFDLQNYERICRSYNAEAKPQILNSISRNASRIVRKIEEFVHSGKLNLAQKAWREEMGLIIESLSCMEGMGCLRATELAEAGIRDVTDLFYHTDVLTRQQLIGLEYFEDLKQMVPRSEVEGIADVVRTSLCSFADIPVTICGSFRRGLANCDSIDLLLEVPVQKSFKVEALVESLKKKGLLLDTFCCGQSKISGVCQLGETGCVRRLNVWVASPAQLHCSLLHLTGPREFVDSLVRKATKSGFAFDEYSIRKLNSDGVPGPPLNISSEMEIFELLGMPYVDPFHRK